MITGSEDHSNGGWYALMDRWDGAMSLPLHGAPWITLCLLQNQGDIGFICLINFHLLRVSYHTIEHGPTGMPSPD